MIEVRHKWTKEECAELASKCTTRTEFAKLYKNAYQSSTLNKWLDDICSHMDVVQHQWTKEECQELALGCETRSNFIRLNESAYHSAGRYGWLDEICSHMIYVGNILLRGIYVYKIENFNGKKYAYCGLTYNFKKRHNQHELIIIQRSRGTGIDKFCFNNNIPLPKMEIVHNYMDANIARIKEDEIAIDLESYGYILLNKAKRGGLGGNILIYTKTLCTELASQCMTRNEFKHLNKAAYTSARLHNWMNEICFHMKEGCHKWTKEECVELASQCTTRNEFNKLNKSAYNTANVYNNWMDEICSHMIEVRHKWTKKECAELTSHCTTRNEFKKLNISAYQYSRKHGWFEEICSHMSKPHYWTDKECIKLLSTCNTKNEARKNHYGAFTYAYNHKLLNIIFE